MEKSGSTISINSTEEGSTLKSNEIAIPSQLKFPMNNLKIIINNSLNVDNFPLWKSQVSKLFSINGFLNFLDGSTQNTSKHMLNDASEIIFNLEYKIWMLTDQNLAGALYSNISPSLLPYVLSLNYVQRFGKH